ncbi:portal protein [Aurantiacibacter spongiae]|uniref:Portal protein n=1 Tax=Aurantiacibacter spongiae TaxID=2488860 RepID=A0A3N5CND2_9SPHN|nr:portal protein [Aurantiacibacter spongiae]RPF70453.1 hypothetical protein EG799_01520 [Aurantiacibacter spongiae]
MQADLSQHDTALEKRDTGDDALAQVHARAIKRFDACAWPQQELRAQSLQARRFVSIPGAQWEDEWGEQFANSIRVTVDKVGRGLRKIETDYRENRIVPDFRPDGPKSDAETAETLDGMHRADGYRFKSQQARDNAAYEAFAGGFGAYRLTNEWEDESDKDNDHQRINPAAIIVDADQSVYFDPNARLYDKSDARYAFIRTSMTKEAFEEEYPDAKAEFPDGTALRMTDWFAPETRAVAEYYEVEEVNETLHVLTHRLSGEEKRYWASDFDDGELAQMKADGWQDKTQRRKRKRVHKYVLSGAEVLEDCGLIAGQAIPIVPIYGRRYFVENMERWQGYVQDKMDAQRLYNSNLSKLAELNSLSPQERPIFDPEQMDPVITGQWARANIDRLPFLLAHSLRDAEGNIIKAGPLSYIKPPDLPPAMAAMLQINNADLLEESQDGADTVKANTSAEAMDIAATRVDARSGIYLDNVRQSVQREGEIYLSMCSDIYIEAGREVETMTEDGDDGQAVLQQLRTDNDKTRIVNDLISGRYKVIASVTEATATRRDKTVKSMLQTAEVAIQAQDAELAQAAILTAVLNQDGEGIDEFHEWARQRGLRLGLVKPNEDEQKAMEEAAQNQQPDPMAEVARAQAAELMTQAEKNKAEVDETKADTALKLAKRDETLAGTIEKIAQAGKTRREALMGGLTQ